DRGVGARGGGRRPGQGARAQGPLCRRARRARLGAVDRGAAAAEYARRGLPIGAGGVRGVAWRWRAGAGRGRWRGRPGARRLGVVGGARRGGVPRGVRASLLQVYRYTASTVTVAGGSCP